MLSDRVQGTLSVIYSTDWFCYFFPLVFRSASRIPNVIPAISKTWGAATTIKKTKTMSYRIAVIGRI